MLCSPGWPHTSGNPPEISRCWAGDYGRQRWLRFHTRDYLCCTGQHDVPVHPRNSRIVFPPQQAFPEPRTTAKIQITQLSALPEARPSHRPLDRHLWPSTPRCWDAGYFVLRSLTQVSPNACLPVFLDLLSLGSLCRTFPLPLPSSFPGALPCLAVSIQKQAVNLGALHFTPWCQLDSPIP